MDYSSRDIDVIEGLEVIRRRPAMYIGGATEERTLCSRLVESIVSNAAADSPARPAVRLIVWAGGALTVAFDGEPLSIAPQTTRSADVPHPELYSTFMYIVGQPTMSGLGFGAAILNALSGRLIVSTMHAGVRYRAAFSRGALVSLLSRARTTEALGTNWLTFQPDADVVPGAIDFAEAEAIVARVATTASGTSIAAIDRSDEKPDWW